MVVKRVRAVVKGKRAVADATKTLADVQRAAPAVALAAVVEKALAAKVRRSETATALLATLWACSSQYKETIGRIKRTGRRGFYGHKRNIYKREYNSFLSRILLGLYVGLC
jgi:hypothetical protein